MAPIWWSSLFIMFILAYLLVMTNMYFLYINSNLTLKKTLKTPNKNIKNWKW